MKFKKGFTLAEILIVLTVIGVIATIVIPSTMKGVAQAHYIASYKKALNKISSFALLAKLDGYLPRTNISAETMRLFQALNDNLNVIGYVSNNVNSGIISKNSDYRTAISIDGHVYGSGEVLTKQVTSGSITTVGPSPWIVTDDNMAYSVMCGGITNVRQLGGCATKAQIASQPTQIEAIKKSCAIIIVDVNGLSKGPNKYDPQAGPQNTFILNTFEPDITADKPLDTLTGDQYLIFLGLDGATAGPRATTVTGRIASDKK